VVRAATIERARALDVTGPASTAVVTGAGGQDGFYLVERLLADGCSVHAAIRPGAPKADLTAIPNADRLTIHELDATDADAGRRLIADVRPDELFNLAGLSSVSRSFDDPSTAWRTNAQAVQGLLEAVRTDSPATRFYQASSTDMFGSAPGETTIHDERSAFRPQSPYAASKAAAHVLCDAYRRAFDLRIACGILSNHESGRRPASFLTAKVAAYLRELRARRERGQRSGHRAATLEPLRVGNLSVRREWGFAPDYVDGMIRICRQIDVRAEVLGTPPDPDVGGNYRDYILGTGIQMAVWELIDRAFGLAGFELEWDRSSSDPARWTARIVGTGELVVLVDDALLRPADPLCIGTDPSLARRELGWEPTGGLDAVFKEMLRLP
jgi:GDPmannose 4,6-dehydratase